MVVGFLIMAEIPFPGTNREQRPIRREALQTAVRPVAYESPTVSTVDISQKANLFGALSDIGVRLYSLMQTREAANQLSRAQGDIRAGVFGYEQWGRENPYNPDNGLEEFNSQMSQVHENIDSYLTNPKAKEEFQNWYAEHQSIWADSAMERSFLIDKNLKRSQAMQRLDVIKNTSFSNEKSLQEGLQAIDDNYNDMIAQGLLSPQELAGMAATIEALKSEKKTQWAQSNIEGQARQLAIVGGWNESIKFVTNPKNQNKWSKEYGVSLSDIKKLTTDLNTMFSAEERIANEQLEQQREKDRDAIGKAIDALDVTTPEMIDQSSLNETEQGKFSDRFKEAIKIKAVEEAKDDYTNRIDDIRQIENPTDREKEINKLVKEINKSEVLTEDEQKSLVSYAKGESADKDYVNWPVYDELSSEAVKVYLNEESRSVYEQKVNTSFYNREFPDSKRQELFAKMDDPLTPAQAKAIQKFKNDTKSILLKEFSSAFKYDEVGNLSIDMAALLGSGKDTETARRKIWYAQQYEKDITNWVLTHDGNVGTQFEQYADEAKFRWWNTSKDDEAIKAKVEEAQKPKGIKTSRPQPKSKEEYNALEIGTEYIAPDGSVRIKR